MLLYYCIVLMVEIWIVVGMVLALEFFLIVFIECVYESRCVFVIMLVLLMSLLLYLLLVSSLLLFRCFVVLLLRTCLRCSVLC